MADDRKSSDAADRSKDRSTEAGHAAPKQGGSDVGPPGERVDDETSTAESKQTRRQE